MPNPEKPEGYLVDTSIFIHWFRGDKKARDFFHSTPRKIYYSKITKKELFRNKNSVFWDGNQWMYLTTESNFENCFIKYIQIENLAIPRSVMLLDRIQYKKKKLIIGKYNLRITAGPYDGCSAALILSLNDDI